MASKKCSKCGEVNPNEAAICWACYTPLEGIGSEGSVRPSTAAKAKPSHINDPNNDEGTKKEIDLKTFAIGGLLLLGVTVAVIMKTGFFSGNGDSNAEAMPPADPSGTVRIETPPPLLSLPSSSVGSGGTVPPAQALPYNVVVPPNPKYATGTLGILATQQNLSQTQAGGLAKFARDQFARNGKWTGMQIAVFSDPAAAKQFASYQAKRRGAPLNAIDYQHLANSNIWMGAPAFYQLRGKEETISYPSTNPRSWWN